MTVLWGPVRGQVVFDSAWSPPLTEQAASGFSLMGTRSLLVTDAPAVYVHDTGGLASASVTALDPAVEPAAALALTDRSTRLLADLRLAGGKSARFTTGPLSPQVLAEVTRLGGRLLPDAAQAAFVSPCAVSVTPRYEPDPPAGPAQAAPELLAYVVVRAGRLELRWQGQVLLDWPVNRVVATPTGVAEVEIQGGAVLQGRFLTGALLYLVTPHVRQAFLTAVRATAGGAATVAVPGTSAPVVVRGLDSGAETRVDCVLGESTLEFQARDAATVLASFDLTDPQLRVAGSAERFVVFHPAHGPVAARSDAEVFGQRLQNHPGVRTAAARTLAAGPFPAELADGTPVACAVAPDAVRVKGPGTDLRVPFSGIRTIEGEATVPRARLTLATERSEVTLVAQLELVQALHTEVVTGRNATADPRQVPDLLRAAVGLEEDYFLYAVFGPCYELHAALLGPDPEPPVGGLAAPLPVPVTEPERARAATVFAEGLAEIQRHLDQVGTVLPAFVRHRDAQLLIDAGLATADGAGQPGWLKEQEAALRQALVPVARLAGETATLAAQVWRLLELDPSALPRPSYTGAAITLGAAALLNPVFAVAGATQAYRQYSQGEQRKAQVGAQAERGWKLVVDRWNTLVGTALPMLGYLVTENLFGPRWEAARRLAEHLRQAPVASRQAAMRSVARRLARLDVMRRYPAGAGVRLRRGEIAEHLRAAREAVQTPRFADF